MQPLEDEAVRLAVATAVRDLWPRRFPPNVRRPPKPRLTDLLGDLEVVATLNGHAEVDGTAVRVRFDSEKIELDDRHGTTWDLGRFRVTLEATFKPGNVLTAVEAEALDPNPCRVDEETVHPHVQAGNICLGNGHNTAHALLAGCRFAAVTDVVLAVLRTYNRHGPYHHLEAWEGVECGNCGRVSAEDDRSSCPACDEDMCDGCEQSRCGDCGTYYHSGCIDQSCGGCDDPLCGDCGHTAEDGNLYCSGCASRCTSCRGWFANDDLEDGQCEGCRPDEDEDEDESDADEDEDEDESDADEDEDEDESDADEDAADRTAQCSTCLKMFTPDEIHRGVCAPCYARKTSPATTETT